MTTNFLENPYKAHMDTDVRTASQANLNGDQVNSTLPSQPIDPTVKPESDDAAERSQPIHPGTAATSIPSPAPVDFTKNLPILPSPPFVQVEGVPNFRDLGGYACPAAPGADPSSGPYRVRPGLIYRCATLSQITIKGSDVLTQHLGIKDLYDLRSSPETTRVGAIPEIPGLKRHFSPVYETEDYSPEVLAKKYKWYTARADTPYTYRDDDGVERTTWYSPGFINAYRDIATHAARPAGEFGVDGLIPEGPRAEVAQGAYRTILRRIFSEVTSPATATNTQTDRGPLIFHCTAGKDRTGVLAAVILRLCRVPEDVVVWEYSITEPGLGAWREEIVARMTHGGSHVGAGTKDNKTTTPPANDARDTATADHDREKAKVLSGGGAGGGGMTRAEALRICGSKAANMRVWLREVLEGEFGGADAYVVERCGFEREEVEALRRGLVEKGIGGLGVVGVEGWGGNEGRDED